MTTTKELTLRNIRIGGNRPLVLIAGPCLVENKSVVFRTAETLAEITNRLKISLIYKSSYRKANRTSIDGFTGIGDDDALRILQEVKTTFNLPILTDIHSVDDIPAVAEVANVLQIPAFLSRQTDLLIAAGKTGIAVNIKKGQFMAPEDMKHAAAKVASTGNEQILLCERGTAFGYHNLVVDMRGLLVMRETGYPVVMDATHSVQLPSQGNISGGMPQYIRPLARAAAAVGIDALFIETHPDPANAKSDAASQLKLDLVEQLLLEVMAIDRIVKDYPDTI